MLLAIITAAARERLQMTGGQAVLVRVAVFCLVGVIFICRESSPFVDLFFHSLCGLAFALLLASTVWEAHGSGWERSLSHPALKYLGLISYSVYIWHEPIMIELGQLKLLVFDSPTAFPFSTLALVLVVLVVASISYYAIEYPTQYLRYLFTREGRLAKRYP